MSGEERIAALADEVETWKRKFRMADQNRRVRQKKADKPKHPQPNRLSFSVSREEAEAIVAVLNPQTCFADVENGGFCMHFAAKMKRALARGELLGKEGK